MQDLSIHFGRTKGAIYSRIKKLELVEELYSPIYTLSINVNIGI